MLVGASSSRLSRVAHRWRDAKLVILALVASGFVVALGFRSPDVSLYEHYARAALSSPLFHSLPKEYPASSLGIFADRWCSPYPTLLGFALLQSAPLSLWRYAATGLELPGLVPAGLRVPNFVSLSGSFCPL